MAFIKTVVFAALVGVIAAQQAYINLEPDPSSAKYQFSYHVDDPTTGDQKQQEEIREGNSVRGFYTVAEPDGTIRRVDYTADEENGFQATVSRQAGAANPHPVVQHAPVVQQQAIHVIQSAPRVITRPVVQPTVSHVSIPQVVQPVYHAPTHYVEHPEVLHTDTHVVHAAPQYSYSHSPLVSYAPVATVPQYVTRTVARA